MSCRTLPSPAPHSHQSTALSTRSSPAQVWMTLSADVLSMPCIFIHDELFPHSLFFFLSAPCTSRAPCAMHFPCPLHELESTSGEGVEEWPFSLLTSVLSPRHVSLHTLHSGRLSTVVDLLVRGLLVYTDVQAHKKRAHNERVHI